MTPRAAAQLGVRGTIALLVATWLTFRLTSDWPRGLAVSGHAGVPEWAMSLSYFGLCLWTVFALPAALAWGRIASCVRSDPIVQAQLLFLLYQLVSLGSAVATFGIEGAIAGIYILLVSASFLVLYLFGVRLGECADIGGVGRRILRNTRLVAWALAPTLLIAVFQLITGTGKDVGDGILRVYGGTSSPNLLAAIIFVAGAPLFAVSSETRRASWFAFLLASMVLFVACLSLAGFACLVFSMAFYWLRRASASRSLPISFGWIVVGLVGLALLALLAGEVLEARVASLTQSENSLVWRLRTWLDLLEVLSDPRILVFGGGLGYDHLGVEYGPHNEYLRVLMETGLVGLSMFLLIWYRAYHALTQAVRSWHPSVQRYAGALEAVTVGLLIWALADSVLRTAPSVVLLWPLIGVAVGLANSRVRIQT